MIHNSVTCLECGKVFPHGKDKSRPRKYCSRSCSVTWNNRNSPKRKKSPESIRAKSRRGYSTCPSCGGDKSIQANLCRKCTPSRTAEAQKLWLSGDVSASWNKDKEPKSFVKKYLRETRGDRCEVCGFDEKAPDGRSIIQMDHIDGDYTNNRLNNLRLLCPNHHAMTSNYGSLNKGKGRKHRRKTVETNPGVEPG